MRTRWIWVLWLLGLALAASYPLTATDDLGHRVRLDREPRRIVVMLPSATETLCALGACDRIVGTDDFSNWPEAVKKLPKLGGLYNPSVEKIVALKPDLVIASPYGKLAPALARVGIPVFVVKTETYDDIFKTARELGRLVGREAQAEALVARIRAQVYALESKAAKSKTRPTVYYEIDPTPYTVGPDSFIGVLIQKARGRNIIPRNLGLFPKISPELVVAKNPEVIVLGDAPYGVTYAKIKARPGWAGIRAVKDRRVCELTKAETDVVHRPGPRVAEGLRVLIRCIHPEVLR